MPIVIRLSAAISFALCLAASAVVAQTEADGPVLGARHATSKTSFKMYNPDGRVRIMSWNRDSVLVRGRVAKPGQFFFGGGAQGMKLGVEVGSSDPNPGRSDFVVYVPRGSNVSIHL